MTNPNTKKIKSRLLAAVILAAPSVVLAAAPPAKVVAPKVPASSPAKPGASLGDVSTWKSGLLGEPIDYVSLDGRGGHASEFEPPGRPPGRPPGDPPGHDNPPNPPGQPPGRPPGRGNR